jgi:Flp pilus assembly protein TadG
MLKLKFIQKIRGCKGQSIVEMSLIAPLLLVALYIPADFGIAMFTAHLTQNAVREAARIGVSTRDPFDDTAATAIANEALNRIPNRLNAITVTVNYYASNIDPCMQSVAVTAQGNYNYFFYRLMNIFGASVPVSVPITRTSQMRYEFQPVTNATPMCSGSPLETGTASRS